MINLSGTKIFILLLAYADNKYTQQIPSHITVCFVLNDKSKQNQHSTKLFSVHERMLSVFDTHNKSSSK